MLGVHPALGRLIGPTEGQTPWVRWWPGKKRRLPAKKMSSVSLLPRASKASRNSLKSLETKAGWSFLVAAGGRCGVAEQADRLSRPIADTGRSLT
ncbi:MAG: hypothetical protein AUG46_00915 [Acidobacteria bacterium 13_1_20CM_3_58_11]|nr:MAG: hypothetical protein AUG46_00915 [Acidobacteria bacterium 13_1_20CM_3_58_11]